VAARSAPVGLLVASAWVSLALSGSPAALPQQAVSYGTASESQVSELESEYPGRAYSLNGLFAHPRYGSLAQIPEANLLTYSNSQASLLLRMPSKGWDLSARSYNDGDILVVQVERLPRRHIAVFITQGSAAERAFDFYLEQHGRPAEKTRRGEWALTWTDVKTGSIEGGLPIFGDIEYFPLRQLILKSSRWSPHSMDVGEEALASIWSSIEFTE